MKEVGIVASLDNFALAFHELNVAHVQVSLSRFVVTLLYLLKITAMQPTTIATKPTTITAPTNEPTSVITTITTAITSFA